MITATRYTRMPAHFVSSHDSNQRDITCSKSWLRPGSHLTGAARPRQQDTHSVPLLLLMQVATRAKHRQARASVRCSVATVRRTVAMVPRKNAESDETVQAAPSARNESCVTSVEDLDANVSQQLTQRRALWSNNWCMLGVRKVLQDPSH